MEFSKERAEKFCQITELHAASTLGELRERVRNAFISSDQARECPAGIKTRLFIPGKELKNQDATFEQLGLVANARVHALFTTCSTKEACTGWRFEQRPFGQKCKKVCGGVLYQERWAWQRRIWRPMSTGTWLTESLYAAPCTKTRTWAAYFNSTGVHTTILSDVPFTDQDRMRTAVHAWVFGLFWIGKSARLAIASPTCFEPFKQPCEGDIGVDMATVAGIWPRS